jgi:hypothetical protein
MDKEIFKALELDMLKKHNSALDVIYDYIDDLLLEGAYNKIDEVLETVAVKDWSNVLLVGFLTITLAAKLKLKNREKLFFRIKEVLSARTERYESILKGLA